MYARTVVLLSTVIH